MIYLFIGPDAFSQRKAVDELKSAVGTPDSRDANVSLFQGATLSPAELVSSAQAMPFLAEKRLIIVDGLLRLYNERARGPNARKPPREASEWEAVVDALRGLPPTTDVVFQDAEVTPRNPVLAAFSPIADVQRFDPLPPDRLRRWLDEQSRQRGIVFSPAAQTLLVDLVGPDLWTLHNELEKLALYAHGRTVSEDDVTNLVAATREVRIFGAVDAVVERNASLALRRLQALLTRGEAEPIQVRAMLARQARLMLLAQELVRAGVPQQEIAGRLGLNRYPLQKTLDQARRYSWSQLVWLHDKLLKADIATKTGALDEETALEVLVAELSSPPRQAPPPSPTWR